MKIEKIDIGEMVTNGSSIKTIARTVNKLIDLQQNEVEVEKKDKRWKPEEGDRYYKVNGLGDVKREQWDCGHVDKWNLKTNNVFKTEELAQAHLDYLNAIAEVKDYIYENDLQLDDVDTDWSNGNQSKWYLAYEYSRKWETLVSYSLFASKALNILPYLKSKEACEEIIKAKKDALLVIFK